MVESNETLVIPVKLNPDDIEKGSLALQNKFWEDVGHKVKTARIEGCILGLAFGFIVGVATGIATMLVLVR